MKGHAAKPKTHDDAPGPRNDEAPKKKKSSVSDAEASQTTEALDWVLTKTKYSGSFEAANRFQDAIYLIYSALMGNDGGKRLTPEEELEDFDKAMKMLAPYFEYMRESDADRETLNTKVLAPARSKRGILQANLETDKQQQAGAEVNKLAGTLSGTAAAGEAYEPKDKEEEKDILRATIAKTISTANQLSAIITSLKTQDLAEGIKEELGELEEGKGGLAMGTLIASLSAADNLLTLTDEEFYKELDKGLKKGGLTGVRSMTEFVAKLTETANSLVQVVAKGGALVASLLGNSSAAAKLAGLGEFAEATIGKTAAVIGIVHGLMGVLDPRSSGTERMDGAVEVASAGFALAGQAGPGLAITGWWLGIKTTGIAYLQAVDALRSAGLAQSWYQLGARMESFSELLDRLSAAGILANSASDADKPRYEKITTDVAAQLGGSIDTFLNEVSTVMGWYHGGKDNLGDSKVMRREWDAYLPLSGKRTPEEVVPAADKILKKILWCITHAQELFDEQGSGDTTWGAWERRKEEKDEIWKEERGDETQPEYIGDDW